MESPDISALTKTVRDLERKLESVSQREREYRGAVERLEDELRTAGALQRALLPTRLPGIKGLDVRVLFRPCSPVSGDVYDIFRIDEAHVAFVIADATGHGVPAALLSTLIRRTLRGVQNEPGRGQAPAPDRVLRLVNDELFDLGLDGCQFVAATYAVFDERSGVMRLARGGTPFPVLLRDGATPQVVHSEGPIVGAIHHARFEVVEIPLRPRDHLLLYTDGVEPLIGAKSDAESVSRSWIQMMNSSLEGQGASPTAEVLIDRLDRAIADGAGAHDDVTLLMIERREFS